MNPTKIVLTLMLSTFFICLICSCEMNKSKEENQSSMTLKQILKEKEISEKEAFQIHIVKSKRILEIKLNDRVIKTYPVVLGPHSVGDKRCEGDKKTPEGIFKVKSKFEHRKWDKFIWVDYPNEDSWEKFNESKRLGEIDSKSTIGGEIGIHGVPEGRDDLIENQVDWTLGCISLKNKDINEFYSLIDHNTWEIKIEP